MTGTAVADPFVLPSNAIRDRLDLVALVDYNHPEHGALVEGARCGARSPSDGYVCTRRDGHPEEWQHIGATTTRIVAAWGGWVDPFAAVVTRTAAVIYPGWDDPDTGIRVPERTGWCEYARHGSGGVCTRRGGHRGQHISTRGSAADGFLILWVEPNTAAPAAVLPPQVGEFHPGAEDGSPADAVESRFTAAPPVAEVVKLRDRVNRMYVLGARDSGEAEVLDLSTRQLRVVPFNHLVKIDSFLSVEELENVTRWYAGHREDVRKVAIREHRSGRWCASGLNQNLESMGMEPHTPTLHGEIVVTVPFECPDIHATQSHIEAAVNAALSNPEVAAAMRVALPPVDGVELDSAALAVAARNFTRN